MCRLALAEKCRIGIRMRIRRFEVALGVTYHDNERSAEMQQRLEGGVLQPGGGIETEERALLLV